MSKKPKKQSKSLNDRFAEKKINKITKQGLQLFRCVGGCHMPDGCGFEFTNRDGYAVCPRCQNQYCLWLNAPE